MNMTEINKINKIIEIVEHRKKIARKLDRLRKPLYICMYVNFSMALVLGVFASFIDIKTFIMGFACFAMSSVIMTLASFSAFWYVNKTFRMIDRELDNHSSSDSSS